jgi:hypothetical protein
MTTPSVEEIDRIAQQGDAIVRNLEITQCYYEISQGIAALIGSSANWCTFATWASKQAGQTIRQEDLLRAFAERFNLSSEVSAKLETVSRRLKAIGVLLHGKLTRAAILQALNPAAAFARAGDAVARGNKKVFEEIGCEFARFLSVVGDGSSVERDKISAFCAALRPGGPPEGQKLLAQAFSAYYEARSQNGKDKAELILFANLCAGFHEQTRLQPEIAEALNAGLAPAQDLKRNLLSILVPGFTRVSGVNTLLLRPSELDLLFAELIELVNRMIRQVITDHLMTLHLSNAEVLRLGRDLSNRFPESLAQISNSMLKEVLARVDLTPDNLRGSGADDWASFADRMHFIADFFRVYQERAQLFDAPFTDLQAALIKSGKRPEGFL